MGYNATVVVMLDSLDEIRKDKNFGEKLFHAILKVEHGNANGIDISSGHSCNAATVIEKHHADGVSLIAVGGNCASVLSSYVGSSHVSEENRVNILKTWADQMGYRVVKKPKKD
jgi:hypothetical protein